MSVSDIAALPAVAALEAALVGAVDAERMMGDVRYLSTLERHSGTADERAAFAYIARQCRDAGITDVREYAFDAYLSFPLAGWLYVSGVGPVKAKTRAFASSVGAMDIRAGSVVNAQMLRAVRHLTALSFAQHGHFRQEPALDVPALPDLAAATGALLEAPPESDTAGVAGVSLVRARNRATYALIEATRALA